MQDRRGIGGNKHTRARRTVPEGLVGALALAMSLSTMAAASVLAALLGLMTVPRLVVPSPFTPGAEAATGVAVEAGSSALCPLACSHSSAVHALDSGSFHTYTNGIDCYNPGCFHAW